MNISLCSQSLFALDLDEMIEVTAKLGFGAMEIACRSPHFDLETARYDPKRVARRIRHAGLAVSALSLFTNFTDLTCLDEQVEAAETFIRLAPLFETKTVKITPGRPGSQEAEAEHWQCLKRALDRLVPVADQTGQRLAFETHMRQLTDTLASSKRFLEMTESDTVGLTVDFSNLAFAGERMSDVISSLKGRMYNAHVKNGYVDTEGGWHFQALDKGLIDYSEVLRLLRDADYSGYLSIECLGPEAQKYPARTAQRDLEILKSYLKKTGWNVSG